jgi:predicted nucleotidyltransferase
MKSTDVTRDFILETLRANQERLRNEFGIERIGLYGSFARNEQTSKSDIDLVYKMVEGYRLSLQRRDELQKLLSHQLSKKIDLINQQYMNPFTSYSMRKDVICVQ